MTRLLSVVEGRFQLSGCSSVIVTPGIPRAGNWRLKVGDPLTLRLPDGTELHTVVGGVEMLSPLHLNMTSMALMLGPDLMKEDVPLGTEIWVD